MDDYGCCHDEDSDFTKIASKLAEFGRICFSYTEDGEEAYVVSMMLNPFILGSLAFGGDSDGQVWVGILGKGNFHFDPRQKLYSNYVGEKLGLKGVAEDEIYRLLTGVFSYLIS